jgi:hypothetical protein
MRLVVPVTAALWVVLGHAPPARASAVLALTLQGLTTRADVVVVGKVLSVKSRWINHQTVIVSEVEFHATEAWKGRSLVPGDGRLHLVQPGGTVDGTTMRVHGLPEFVADTHAVLFLRRQGAELGLVGLGQGKWDLRFDKNAQTWMADGGDRSAAVTVDKTGRLKPAPGPYVLPIETLRRRVQALVPANAPLDTRQP